MERHATSHLISLALTAEQVRWLDEAAAALPLPDGRRPSHSALLLRLVAAGVPILESEMATAQANRAEAERRARRAALAILPGTGAKV